MWVMPAYEAILYEKRGRVALVTMNRPEIMNALEAPMARELVSAFRDAAADDEIGSIVLTGAGKSFSSGGDLSRLMQGFELLEGRQWLQEGYEQLMELARVKKPVIAAVNGYAVGAGFSLALLCDLIIAADTAKFGMAFVKVGLVPDCGPLFLPAWWACKKRKSWFSPVKISMPRSIPHRHRQPRRPRGGVASGGAPAGATAGRGPAVALAQAKEILNASSSISLEQVMEMEIYAQSLCLQTEDHKEGVIAFLERRRPVFKGW